MPATRRFPPQWSKNSTTPALLCATYYGFWYKEHEENDDDETRLKRLWASLANTRSFWFTPPSLANLMARVGFSSFYECLNPHHALPEDRRAYVAIKGQSTNILSCPKTAAMSLTPKAERAPPSLFQSNQQSNRGPMFRLASPQPIKHAIKSALKRKAAVI
jgi:hypothetical protein